MNIYMIGDSTMKFNNFYSYPQTGWGQVLNLFVKENILVFDEAENGRSTKSFIDEGRFQHVLDNIQKGDFLICQFGHNDEKEYDKTRYTTPFGTYQENLKFFATEIEKKGAHIVFATSITRHSFKDGVCVNSHGDYPKAMLEFAKENNYTCVDLCKLTMDLYNKLGEETSKKFHMIFGPNLYNTYIEGKDDHSHLMYGGAVMVAELFVREILKSNDPIKDCFIDLDKAPQIDWNMLKD
ncbi:MAG: rhamnogalacturonan acetylesterase [Acholeplasmatales bacterium]|nr:rhamnogalacturonan acetylesterase [Acholeplasmatales bacterium]